MKKTSTFLGLTTIALLWACQDKKQEGEWEETVKSSSTQYFQ